MRLIVSEHWAKPDQLVNYFYEYSEPWKINRDLLAYGIVADRGTPLSYDNFCIWYEGPEYFRLYHTFGIYRTITGSYWDIRTGVNVYEYEERPDDVKIIKFIGEELLQRFSQKDLKYKDIRFMLIDNDGKPYMVEGEKEWTIGA